MYLYESVQTNPGCIVLLQEVNLSDPTSQTLLLHSWLLHKSYHPLGAIERWHNMHCFLDRHCNLTVLSHRRTLPSLGGRQRPPTTLEPSPPTICYWAPHVYQAHINMCMHSHTWQKPQDKSQTCLLIFTKSAPPTLLLLLWLYLSFVISAGTGEWEGVTRVRLLFQHLLKERGRGGRRGELGRTRGLSLLNSSTLHTHTPPSPNSDIFGSLFFLFPFL